jgi:hypothetical protein
MLAADRQGVVDALTWLMQESGSGGGGFPSTHPDTAEQITALREGR